MPNKILKRTSFGLLRTNPKLTTNIKIVADSKNRIYLESIDANPYLSKSIYKGFEVSGNGSYSYDLTRFYSQGSQLLPKDLAYSVFEEDDSTTVKNRFNEQYDFTYGYGMYPKNSQLYPEEFSLFAPLWLEKDNIPDYFVIFKMDGPVTVNANDPAYSGQNLDTSIVLNQLVEDPDKFFENVIQKAYVIKTFDLSDKSEIGKYIRKHVNDSNFPESPFFAGFEKGQNSYWQGISYNKGGFGRIGQDFYLDYSLVDKTLIESEDYITDGFKRNSVVCANLLNMEFLFDDKNQERYKFSRYFGLYMSTVELGKFFISKNRLYEDRNREFTQTPTPILNNVGDSETVLDSIQYNAKGIKIYPDVDPLSTPSIYEGRLMNWNELQNSRFGYIRDIEGNFYSIDNINNWESTYSIPGSTSINYITDTNYLRIKDKSVNWKTFGGFELPFAYIPSYETDKKGRPALAFKIVSAPNDGDEIRVRYTDWTNPEEAQYIDQSTIKGLNSLPPRTTNGITFSVNGTLKDISIAIVEAINNIKDYINDYLPFQAMYINDEILVFSRIDSENWNKLKMSFFSDATEFPFLISNEYIEEQLIPNYVQSPVSVSLPIPGKYLVAYFEGGNNHPKSRAVVERENILEFVDDKDVIFLKTTKGYCTTDDYGLYLDEPIYDKKGEIIGFRNYEKYYVINLIDRSQEIEFGSSKKLSLYKKAKNSLGYFSIYPIKDFDFDFHNQDYMKAADSNPQSLYSWYSGGTGGTGLVPLFNFSSFGATSQQIINELIGPTSPFVTNGGFQSLIGFQNDLTDEVEPVKNEYDRLKENDLSQLALSSRVVPFINKWVYDNEGKDVRENGYRLNSDQAFGYGNFSPDFDQVEKTTKFFTHEWYYLQSYPPYMSFTDKLNSYSYFDENIMINPTVGPNSSSYLIIPLIGSTGSTATFFGLTSGTGSSANLFSIDEDYFLRYFTRESITEGPTSYQIPRDFKYSIFSDGTDSKASETLFRGVKVEILDRSEFSPINFNKESLRYVYGVKYNGYKFSAVLTYGNAGTQLTFIKNDKWKTVTLLIQADFNDIFFKYKDNTSFEEKKFIDRSLLYTVSDKLELDSLGTDLEYTDKPLSGRIINWTDGGLGGLFTVTLGEDQNGNFPNLDVELSLNESGSYNNIQISNSPYIYTFVGISNVTANSFTCTEIYGLPAQPNPLIPNGGNGLSNIEAAWSYLASTYLTPLLENPIYLSGGYNGYLSIIDSISFSSIQSQINSGDAEIRYLNVTQEGKVEENTYAINLIRPDQPVKSSYLKRQVLKKTSKDIQQPESILGYTLTALDRIALNPICRYRGSYSPRWKDVFKFIDTSDLLSESLDYYNIQILDDFGYIKDSDLGKMKNVYFNKINTENPNVILQNRLNTDEERFIYPKLDEIAIDYSNYYIFRSNWDPFYYRKYLKKGRFIPIIGTREPKEEKAFFGSKTISIPERVRLQTFPTGIITEEEVITLGSIRNTDKNIVTKERTFASKTDLEVSVYVTRSLQDWLIVDGFGEEFYKYINPSYSFGDLILDDDIKTYIEENIFQRYVIKEVIFWEKVWVPRRGQTNPPQINTAIDDEQKLTQGYKQSKNFKLVLDESGGLNFRVIYTVPRDKKTSIAFTVILEKK
jgi:hypothetical protein